MGQALRSVPFFVEAMWEEKKVAGRHKDPRAVRVNPFGRALAAFLKGPALDFTQPAP